MHVYREEGEEIRCQHPLYVHTDIYIDASNRSLMLQYQQSFLQTNATVRDHFPLSLRIPSDILPNLKFSLTWYVFVWYLNTFTIVVISQNKTQSQQNLRTQPALPVYRDPMCKQSEIWARFPFALSGIIFFFPFFYQLRPCSPRDGAVKNPSGRLPWEINSRRDILRAETDGN